MSQIGSAKLWYVRAGKSFSRYGYGTDIHSKQEINFLHSRQLTTGGFDNDMGDMEGNMRVCKIDQFVYEKG